MSKKVPFHCLKVNFLFRLVLECFLFEAILLFLLNFKANIEN